MGLPKPNLRTQWSNRFGPSFWPIITDPTLEDWARICDVVSVTAPRSWASPMVRSATWICDGRFSSVSGVTLPSWSAPATVNALKVEPGSNAEPTARFWSPSLGPLRGSMTSAVAPLGR